MKRQINKPGGGKLKGVDPLKASERQFGEMLSHMVEYMTRYLRNNVIDQLHQSTVEKFADTAEIIPFALPVFEDRAEIITTTYYTDAEGVEYDEIEVRSLPDAFADALTPHEREHTRRYRVRTGTEWRDMQIGDVLRSYHIADAKQVGNYAAVYLKLNRAAQRKLLKRFDDKRLERIARDVLSKVNRRNAQQFYGNVEQAIGVSAKELLSGEGLQSNINALVLETAQWAKKLRDETLEAYTANTLRVMSQGGSIADVLAQFEDMEEKRKNHAKMVARTQVANFNSLVSKARAENLGLTRAIWITSRDERVRPCHRVRNGKEFDISKGLYSSCDGKWLLPGTDYQCRCTYEFILPED